MKMKNKKTYKNAGFFLRQRELARRRLWPIALTFLSYLIYNVVCIATVLSNTLDQAALNHSSALETTKALQYSVGALLGNTNFSWALLTLPLAGMLAIEGFAWLHSRREVDFYESLPVPRGQRFFDICMGSFLYFIFSYIFTLEIGLLIANGFGALTHALLIEVLHNAVKTIAFFLSIYALGVLSTMLTGNVIVACLAFLVLLSYEMEFRALLDGYGSEFFSTWSGRTQSLPARCIFSPIGQYLENSDFLEAVLRLLALAILFFLLSWICYCLRKNERAGTAVVFEPVQSMVRVAMSVLIALVTGLLMTSLWTRRGFLISVVWMLLFAIITACIMQIIYEYDFRALFRRPLEIAAAILIVLLIYMGFAFDVTGYDRFVPVPDKVADAALVCTNSTYAYSTEEGSRISALEFGEKYMHLENVEDVIAIASYGQEYTCQKNKENRQNGSDSNTENPVTTNEQGIPRPYEEYDFLVVYRMKSGKTITRSFRIPSTMDPAMMEAVIDTDQYREGAFNIYHDNLIRSMPDIFQSECTNGKDYSSRDLTAEQYETFREAYLKDLEAFSYTFARENVPIARLTFSCREKYRNNDLPDYTDCTVSLPIYPSFENTIRVLKDCGIWTEPLDYIPLLRGIHNYNSLTPEQQSLYDDTDMSVYAGPFNNVTYYDSQP